jgi:hypothetical protein
VEPSEQEGGKHGQRDAANDTRIKRRKDDWHVEIEVHLGVGLRRLGRQGWPVEGR